MKKLLVVILIIAISGFCVLETLPTDKCIVNQDVPVGTTEVTTTTSQTAEPVIWFPGKLMIRWVRNHRRH